MYEPTNMRGHIKRKIRLHLEHYFCAFHQPLCSVHECIWYMSSSHQLNMSLVDGWCKYPSMMWVCSRSWQLTSRKPKSPTLLHWKCALSSTMILTKVKYPIIWTTINWIILHWVPSIIIWALIRVVNIEGLNAIIYIMLDLQYQLFNTICAWSDY